VVNLALEAAQKYLTIIRGVPINSWMEIWADGAIVEFPYAPSTYHKRLEGKEAIFDHYKSAASVMDVLEEKPFVVYPSSDPLVVVVEASIKFHIKSTGKIYDQDYISVVKVREDGKIVLYREYWDPVRVLETVRL
jgi:ketosteroid isomerase-like protein